MVDDIADGILLDGASQDSIPTGRFSDMNDFLLAIFDANKDCDVSIRHLDRNRVAQGRTATGLQLRTPVSVNPDLVAHL